MDREGLRLRRHGDGAVLCERLVLGEWFGQRLMGLMGPIGTAGLIGPVGLAGLMGEGIILQPLQQAVG